MKKTFRILSINISAEKGVQKKPVERAKLVAGHGIEGDAHAGPWHRQVSFLADEDIDTMRGQGIDLSAGDFAENITTRGIPVGDLPIGTIVRMGKAELEITQIGKECHHGCAIYAAIGDCVMPRKGVFARVLRGGEISSQSVGSYEGSYEAAPESPT